MAHEGEDCCICLEEKEGSVLVVLKCGHSIHSGCFDELRKQASCCPVCREPFQEEREERREGRDMEERRGTAIQIEKAILMQQATVVVTVIWQSVCGAASVPAVDIWGIVVILASLGSSFRFTLWTMSSSGPVGVLICMALFLRDHSSASLSPYILLTVLYLTIHVYPIFFLRQARSSLLLPH